MDAEKWLERLFFCTIHVTFFSNISIKAFKTIKNDPNYIFEKVPASVQHSFFALARFKAVRLFSGTDGYLREIQACLCVITSHLKSLG